MAGMAGTAVAQTPTLDTLYFTPHDTIRVHCDTSPSGVIFDDGGPNGNYSVGPYYSGIILDFNPGDTLVLSGRIAVENNVDILSVSAYGHTYGFGTDGPVNISIIGPPATISFRSDASIVDSGIVLYYTVHPCNCNNGIGDFFSVQYDPVTAYFYWQAENESGPFVLRLNGQETIVNSTSQYIGGMQRGTYYDCGVCSVADSANADCWRHHSFSTELCYNTFETFAVPVVTDSSVTLTWTSDRYGATYLVSDGINTYTTTEYTYTFSGMGPNTTRTYTVRDIRDTCCDSCAESLTVTTNCLPATVSGIRPLIGADTVTLTAGTADSYLWSTGETTQSIEVSLPGYYTLIAYSGGGCADTLMVGISNIDLDIDIDLPDYLCPGDATNVRVGVGSSANVAVSCNDNSTLSDPTRIFLPDGVNCDPTSDHGCSYRSELEFSGFGNYQLVTDGNDIRYVMLDIEHSFIGDIYINITCPNGQNADILKFSGNGTSSCTADITSDHRGWQGGNNCIGCYLGDPVDMEDWMYGCDSTRPDNIAGTGWRYCWSNSSDAGYTYAAGDGLIYRRANLSNDPYTSSSFDSSNVAAGTNFYHPEQNLSELVGCPMNGTWYIEVIDGWGGDNGYIFGWELALNPDRLARTQYTPTVANANLTGMYVTRNSDTTFTITCPSNLTSDTTITYTVQIYDTAGHMFDSSFTITFHAPYTGTVVETILENQLPYTRYGQTFNDEVTGLVLTVPNEGSCDSIITYTLMVIPSGYSVHDTTVCDDELPLTWHGHTFTAAGTQSFMVTTSYGGDSTVTLNVYVNPTYSLSFSDTLCSGQTVTFEGTTYSTTGTYTHSLTTAEGCDSVRTLQLTVYPNSAEDTVVDVCDQFTLGGTTYTASDTVTLGNYGTNMYGCDSSLTLYLTVRHSNDSNIWAEACDSFYWFGQWLTASTDTTLTHTLTNSVGCDSAVNLVKLDIYPTRHYDDSDTACASELTGGYTWRDTTLYTTTGGTFTYSRQDNHGCDSIFTLDLSVVATAYGTVYDTIVENQAATWSYNGIAVSHDTVMTVTLTSASGCDSIVTYHLKVWPNVSYAFDSTICDDDISSFSWHGRSYSSTITVVLLDSHGADSTVTLTLHIQNSYHIGLYDTICSNESFYFEGNTYNTTGDYAANYTTSTPTQCDSIRTLHLTVFNTTIGDTTVTVCDTFVWYGTTYTVSALDTLTGVYTNAAGCDSSVALQLTVNHSTAAEYNDTCAENYLPRQYIHVISYSDTSGVVMVIPNAVGCDSVITYSLHVWRNVYDTIDSTICASVLPTFSWNGQSPALTMTPGTTPGVSEAMQTDTMHATIPTVHGADSIITMVVHVNPVYAHDFYDTICDNQFSTFVDTSYHLAGDYGHTLQSATGCDSLVTLHLAVNPTYSADFYDTVYIGDTVVFEGNAYYEPGVYEVTYSTQLGCDSTLVLNLTGKNIITRSITDSLCDGDSLWFMTRYLKEEGIYYDTIFTGDFYLGDTVVELNLVVVTPPEVSIDTTHMCEPEPLFILEGQSEAPYFLWTSIPIDNDLDGHENDTLVEVSPKDSSWYYLYVDYREEPLCPATDSVLLPPIDKITAAIEIVPQAITLDDRAITAYNRSTGRYTSHKWYVWYDGVQAFTSTDVVLQLEVPATVDSVQISLQVFSNGCADAVTVDVPIHRSGILFPNIFTPTLDNNNTFAGVGKGVIEYEIWIYDRRGDIVYHGTDIHNGWDGTKDGKDCQQGVYVYYCRYTDQLIPNGVQTARGTVTLVR